MPELLSEERVWFGIKSSTPKAIAISRTETPKICCANSRWSFRPRMSLWTWRSFMVAPRMARADTSFRCRLRPSNLRNGCSLHMMRPNWRTHPISLAWRKYGVCERQAWHRRKTLAERNVSMEIFVGNLAYTATEQELRQLFEAYGVVDRVNILQDRDTGRPRGFGFVTMPDTTEAQAAIAGLQGTTLGGRTLSVNEARPREDRGGPRRPRG